MKTFKEHLLDEDLRKWFGKGKEGDWVRVGTDGEIKGECAREEGEGKPKCMPRSRAHGMDKDDRAKSARRKRRKDPVADRPGKGGKPVMVKTEETISEKNVPTKPALWSKYKAQAKAKFDVYPSAYANGWASKMYKKAGGGWKTVSESMSDRISEACWTGYKQKGMKKKGDKNVPNCVPEGKEHSWKSEGHYTKDGKEWKGDQHAHNGQVMTGKKHTADSQDLYHYKELSPEVRKKVAKTIDEEERKGYTEYQRLVTKTDKEREEGRKKARGKMSKNLPAHAQLRIGARHGLKAAQKYSFPSSKKIKATKYGPAAPDAEAAKRRKAIERHQAKKLEKDYWDDDVTVSGDPILEKLDASKDSIGTYVKDFSKSDAPQFKGAGKAKRRQMAVAAYLKSKRRGGEREMGESIEYDSTMGVMDRGMPAGTEYMKDNTPGESKKKVKDKKLKESGPAHETKAEYRKDNEEDAPVLGDYALTKQDIAELEHEADTITYEKALEYGAFDDEDDEEPEVNITEVLSVQGRLKRKFAARKNRQKLKVARGIALRRGSSPDRLKKRATRGARGAVYKRLLKGRDKSKLPPAEKGRLEKLIGMYAPLVSRLAVRMLPGMRKMEISRMKNRKGGAQKAKKYKAAKPVAKKQTSKKFKIKR